MARAGRCLASLASLLALAPACGTPSRRLPENAIDDAVTLPRRMTAVTAVGWAVRHGADGSRYKVIDVRIDYGLTNRLQLVDLTALRFAFLDDAAVEHAATGSAASCAPLSLAMTAGLLGIGVTPQGWIYLPGAALDLGKRLGNAARLLGSVRWTGRYGGGWDPSNWLSGEVGAEVGMSRRWTFGVGAHDEWGFRARFPWGPRQWHTLLAGPHVIFRPRPFATLALGAQAGARWYAADLQVALPADPLPPENPPRTSLVTAWARAALHW